MAWPLLDPMAHEEMVTDQFLTGLDNHELRVQAATTGARRIEDLMHIARSLEAVEGEETGRGRQPRGSAQTGYTKEEGSYVEANRIVEQILAKLGPELRPSRDPKRHPLTPGPQRVCSAERTETPTPHRDQPANPKQEKRKKIERGHSLSTGRS